MNTSDIQSRINDAYEVLAKSLANGQSETLKQYLDSCAKFHNYSWNNCMLIYLQNPQATRVAGFRRWLDLHRFVKKGEKGIAILAPMVKKRKAKTDEGGKESTYICGFRTTYVFDIAQTDGEPLPEFATSHGDPGELIERLELAIRERDILLVYEPLPCGRNGQSENGAIRLRPDLTPSERFRCLAHELSHEILHHGGEPTDRDKAVIETEAESVAYVVCSHFGIDSLARSSDYIRLWSGSVEQLEKSCERIRRTAMVLIEEIENAAVSV